MPYFIVNINRCCCCLLHSPPRAHHWEMYRCLMVWMFRVSRKGVDMLRGTEIQNRKYILDNTQLCKFAFAPALPLSHSLRYTYIRCCCCGCKPAPLSFFPPIYPVNAAKLFPSFSTFRIRFVRPCRMHTHTHFCRQDVLSSVFWIIDNAVARHRHFVPSSWIDQLWRCHCCPLLCRGSNVVHRIFVE